MDETAGRESRSGSSKVFGAFVWFSILFFSVMSLLTQLHGVHSGFREGIGTTVWWFREYYFTIYTIAFDAYFIYAPVFFFLLALYFLSLGGKEQDGILAIVVSLTSFFTACIWAVFWQTAITASSISELAYSLIVWGGAIVLFGITFSLLGLIYMRRDSRTLTRVTGLSFIIVGLIGLIVGYIGGFTLLPWFTIYDFPWVTAAAMTPCCLALILNAKER